MFPPCIHTWLRVFLLFSVQGKPFLAAGQAAEGRPPVFGLAHFNEGAAVAAMEGAADDYGRYLFGVLPIEPLAMGRAELCPPVRRLCDPHEAAALDTAEAAQGLGVFRRPHVVVHAVSVGIPPAVGAAVFLRHPVGQEFLAADGAYSRPLHRLTLPSPAAIYRPACFQPRQARKKDSINLCCLKHTL
ncbi:Uncharacterised protein [uncultured Ruminococcus sp.]|nr:Uncharacterised protein [uncultured Ruminococcus sp.]